MFEIVSLSFLSFWCTLRAKLRAWTFTVPILNRTKTIYIDLYQDFKKDSKFFSISECLSPHYIDTDDLES